jgi:BirA family biotin operon repressor/biotin-[acetyl-CoA-carboxylase] ligase
MNRRGRALLALLADGALHSGAELAVRLGVSRAAIWKLIGELRSHGVEVHSVARRGYRLPKPVELLDRLRIESVATRHGSFAGTVEVLFDVDSTNTRLYEEAAPRAGQARFLFAEIQHAGRGRRGRSWVAPFGSGLTFSAVWTFAETPPGLPALGLAIGVAVAEALRAMGVKGVGLKWPNDIVWRRRKLGGLLLQVRTESGGPTTVVIGLGLNVSLPSSTREVLAGAGAFPVADLREAIVDRVLGRNELAGALAAAILASLTEFELEGYAPFVPRWSALDALAGESVRVMQGASTVDGVARGADAEGALLVEAEGRIERFHSGDVSLRPSP